MESDPDFANMHGEDLFECYVTIAGEDVTRTVTQKELALWLHNAMTVVMTALELHAR